MTTIAETVAAEFGNDGRVWKNEAGEKLEAVCKARGAKRNHSDARDATRWEFADGSVIVTAGDGWDLALSPGDDDCFCWQGAGEHFNRCARAEA